MTSAPQTIYLVANRSGERLAHNLVRSVRGAGCALPLRVIHYGGEPVREEELLGGGAPLDPAAFGQEAGRFLREASDILSGCPPGYLRRFLPFFGETEFLYSDNDVVALCDWSRMFEELDGWDLVHADEEYRTAGRYNFRDPAAAAALLGGGAMDGAITAGHFLARGGARVREGLWAALEWFRRHGDVTLRHDQVFLLVASLLGGWRVRNLCRAEPPWLSSWSGDYGDPAEVIWAIQGGGRISHLHYSGGRARSVGAMQQLLMLGVRGRARARRLVWEGLGELLGAPLLRRVAGRIRRSVVAGGGRG